MPIERPRPRHTRKPHRAEKHSKHETARKEPRPQGPFQIIVEIAKQQVVVYGQDGLVMQAPISTGMPGHPTPLGVFTVLSKAKWHQSNIYSGAPMPYMQRVTWSGIAMHAGPRPGYPASHGCIRLPEDFAVRLFHTTKVGARVIITRDPAAPAGIVHPKLFVPMQPEEKGGRGQGRDQLRGEYGRRRKAGRRQDQVRRDRRHRDDTAPPQTGRQADGRAAASG